MDDCCALREAIGDGAGLTLGVLDLVADGELEVRAIHTARDPEPGGGPHQAGPALDPFRRSGRPGSGPPRARGQPAAPSAASTSSANWSRRP